MIDQNGDYHDAHPYRAIVLAGTMLVIPGYGILPWMTALGVGLLVVSLVLWWKAQRPPSLRNPSARSVK